MQNHRDMKECDFIPDSSSVGGEERKLPEMERDLLKNMDFILQAGSGESWKRCKDMRDLYF